MIKAIIFDFDGVIVESVDIKTKAFGKLFESEGKEVIKRIISYHLNNTGVSRYDKFTHIYKRILKRTLDDNRLQLLCDKFSNLVVKSVVNAPYVEGAKEFLKNYTSKYRCFVVSATPQDEINKIIIRRHIKHFFIGVYGASIKKSDIVRNILVKEKIRPCDVVYIGDALSDYRAANDNLVKFIARINNNESLFADIDCFKIKDLVNLIDIINYL